MNQTKKKKKKKLTKIKLCSMSGNVVYRNMVAKKRFEKEA